MNLHKAAEVAQRMSRDAVDMTTTDLKVVAIFAVALASLLGICICKSVLCMQMCRACFKHVPPVSQSTPTCRYFQG